MIMGKNFQESQFEKMQRLHSGNLLPHEEIKHLRAKVDVLVEALEALVDNFKTMENGFNKTLFDKARKALATYDKLSEVSDDL